MKEKKGPRIMRNKSIKKQETNAEQNKANEI